MNITRNLNIRKSNIFITSTIIFLVVSACNWLKSDRLPGIDLPLEEMNTDLQLSAPTEISTFKLGDNLRLVLVNSSDSLVILPQDYGAYIFQNVDGKWEAIENRIDYPSDNKIIYPREHQPFREVIIVVHPIIFSDQPVTVRIVVVGNHVNELSGAKEELVGAFIDVTLQP